MKLLAISDTHNKHKSITIPECDILIHSGDATGMGRESEIRNFAKWFEQQPAKHKIFVPGNHELEFENYLPLSKTWFQEECPSGILLINESIRLYDLNIYGSPITPRFYNWAWNADPHELSLVWDAIPDETDILITHGPAYGVLDQIIPGTTAHLGCQHLKQRISQLKLKAHIFGHIHGSHGSLGISHNAAICEEDYYPGNRPIIINLESLTQS